MVNLVFIIYICFIVGNVRNRHPHLWPSQIILLEEICMNEKYRDNIALFLAFIALVISTLPCFMPFFMWRLAPKPFIFSIFGLLLKAGWLLGLPLAVFALFWVRRSENRLVHKVVWAISFYSILISFFFGLSSIIIYIQKCRGE
jgi:hypothetical protein